MQVPQRRQISHRLNVTRFPLLIAAKKIDRIWHSVCELSPGITLAHLFLWLIVTTFSNNECLSLRRSKTFFKKSASLSTSQKERASFLTSVLPFIISLPSSLCLSVCQWISQLAHISVLGDVWHQRKKKPWSLSSLKNLLGANQDH